MRKGSRPWHGRGPVPTRIRSSFTTRVVRDGADGMDAVRLLLLLPEVGGVEERTRWRGGVGCVRSGRGGEWGEGVAWAVAPGTDMHT